jgi:phage shock protein PspC (stress-responsive transcriptional regulator)
MITTMSENNGHGASGTKRLYRRRDGRLVAGVCAGVADYFGIDVTLVRLAFAVFTIFWGLGALLYLVAWAVIPEEGQKTSIVENVINKQR